MPFSKPKICYLRGSYLNPFEAQYLVPLEKEFDITIAGSKSNRFDISKIPLKLKQLPCLDYLNGKISRKYHNVSIPNPFKYFGYEDILLNLDGFLSKFDIVVVPEKSFFFSWQVARKKRKHRYKLITMQHEVNPYWYNAKKPILKRAGLVHQETDHFIARSERAKRALMIEGVCGEKINVIGHGVDINHFHPGERDENLMAQMDIDPDRFLILFIGRMVWTKGIFALADAAKLLLTDPEVSNLNPLFLMVGDGPDISPLGKYLTLLNVDSHFRFVGRFPYQTIPDIHRLADIFVMPSISTKHILEQFGIALIESMACGTPVVSTHCGAIDEVIGDAGVLVQPNDHLRLYEALLKLSNNSKIYECMRRKGLDRVHQKFTHSIISQKLSDLFHSALIS
jgi:glycosyltransferase involved in cell wall biosynthesis